MSEPLSKLQSALLYLIWLKRRRGEGRLITAKELLALLTEGELASEFLALDVKKLKKPLIRLVADNLIESGIASREAEGVPGPPPQGFRLPKDGPAIKWRSTARLVLELFNHPYQPVEYERFLTEMLQLGLVQDDTKQTSTREQFVEQIQYCERKGFIQVEQPGDSAASAATIQCTALVDVHVNFLERIAEAKTMAAIEPGSVPNNSDIGYVQKVETRTLPPTPAPATSNPPADASPGTGSTEIDNEPNHNGRRQRFRTAIRKSWRPVKAAESQEVDKFYDTELRTLSDSSFVALLQNLPSYDGIPTNRRPQSLVDYFEKVKESRDKEPGLF